MVFDFDPDYLFRATEENGKKRYWAIVKATGESVEVSKAVMRYFWSYDRKTYRDSKEETPLSLDTTRSDEWDSWLDDHNVGISKMETFSEAKDFRNLLTEKQREIFDYCLIGCYSFREYARIKGLNHKTVLEMARSIQERAKKYFLDTPPNT